MIVPRVFGTATATSASSWLSISRPTPCKLNFYEMYAKGSPAKKYVITIMPGVTVGGCVKGDTALSFATMPFNATIVINNYGTIEGAGGGGGNATIEKGCSGLYGIGTPGQTGGSAIVTKTGVPVTINNYGIVAGGGGGGGGSGGNSSIPGSFGWWRWWWCRCGSRA